MQRPGPASPSDGAFVPRELAARLLESHFPYTVTGEKPIIFAGRLPEEVPFPIPEGFVLVGGAQFALRGKRRVVEIVLATTLSASRVRDAYRDLLADGGWEEENLDVPGGGGFAHGPRGFLMSLGRTLGRARRGARVDLPGLSTVFRAARRQTLIVIQMRAYARATWPRRSRPGRPAEATAATPGSTTAPTPSRPWSPTWNSPPSPPTTPTSWRPSAGPEQQKATRARRLGVPGRSGATRAARGKRRSPPCTSQGRPAGTSSTSAPTAPPPRSGQREAVNRQRTDG